MKYYHGTTQEKLRVLQSHGLRIGSFVTTDKAVAEGFARDRSKWNGIAPILVVLELSKKQVTDSRLDRSGRIEATTKSIVYPRKSMEVKSNEKT